MTNKIQDFESHRNWLFYHGIVHYRGSKWYVYEVSNTEYIFDYCVSDSDKIIVWRHKSGIETSLENILNDPKIPSGVKNKIFYNLDLFE